MVSLSYSTDCQCLSCDYNGIVIVSSPGARGEGAGDKAGIVTAVTYTWI